jgi:hypothetical protein
VISVEDWAEIRRLHRAEQMPIRAIARQLGISKNTVKRALATDRPPVYSRQARGACLALDGRGRLLRSLSALLASMPRTPAPQVTAFQPHGRGPRRPRTQAMR